MSVLETENQHPKKQIYLAWGVDVIYVRLSRGKYLYTKHFEITHCQSYRDVSLCGFNIIKVTLEGRHNHIRDDLDLSLPIRSWK